MWYGYSSVVKISDMVGEAAIVNGGNNPRFNAMLITAPIKSST